MNAAALQKLVGTEVLPTLENIFLEGFQPTGTVHEGIEKFVAARRLIDRPVAVSHWDAESGRSHDNTGGNCTLVPFGYV